MVTFTLKAKDPSGEFVERKHYCPIVPRIGDTLSLWDGIGWQDISVNQVVLYPDGLTIEVWSEGFDGWAPGSVKALFEARKF